MVDLADFPCSFCSCVFLTQCDLDLHLKAFGAVPHSEVLRLVHVQLEVDGHNAGVDDHGFEFRSFDLVKCKARYWRRIERGAKRQAKV